MKRSFIALCAIAVWSSCSFVAVAQQSPWSFGLKGGINRATVGGEDAQLSLARFAPISTGVINLTADPETKTIFTGGAYVAYAFSDLFSVQAEVQLSGKGVKYNRDFAFSLFESSVSGNLTADADVSYIEIPIVAKLHLPVAGSVRPYVYGGPALGILSDKKTSVRAEVSGISVPGIPAGLPVDIPVTFSFYDMDWSAVIGGGVSFRMENTALGIDARYTMGLQSALKSVQAQNQSAQDVDLRHRVFSITGFMEFYF